MPTSWTPRSTASSSPATPRANTDDLGAGLDETSLLMSDENDNVIIFHTGLYGQSESLYTGRIIP